MREANSTESSPQIFERLLNGVWEENPRTTAESGQRFQLPSIREKTGILISPT